MAQSSPRRRKASPVAAEAPGSFQIGFLLHDVSRLRRTVYDKGLRPLGVTRSQWWVLANLSRTGESVIQTELAKVLDVGKVAVGGLIDRLEASGYIVRKPDASDRRARRISMTPAGKKLMSAIHKRAAILNREMLEGMTPAEIAMAEDILNRLKVRLIEMDSQMRQVGEARELNQPEDPITAFED